MRDELNRVVSKSASIANAYGLDGGIRIPLGGENFCTRPDQTWGSFSFPIKCLPFFWRGGGDLALAIQSLPAPRLPKGKKCAAPPTSLSIHACDLHEE